MMPVEPLTTHPGTQFAPKVPELVWKRRPQVDGPEWATVGPSGARLVVFNSAAGWCAAVDGRVLTRDGARVAHASREQAADAAAYAGEARS